MQLEDVEGFVALYPNQADTEALKVPCGEWAFVFSNGLGALVARNAGTPGARQGAYILSGFMQTKQRPLAALPDSPLVRLTQDEVIDWLFYIHSLGQNGMPHPSMRFPIAHFLHKFRDVEEDGWCLKSEEQPHGRKSVLGWIGCPDTFNLTDEAEALADIFGDGIGKVVGIAEGLDPRYYDLTHPKDIIMAALRDRLKIRNKTRERALQAPSLRNTQKRLRAQKGW